MSVGDLIQHNCQDGKTGLLTVDAAGQRALIYFRDGAIVHAAMGTQTGEEVVYQALSWSDGKFILEMGTASPTNSIQRNWSSLLLEGAKRLEQTQRGGLPGETGANGPNRGGMLDQILKSYVTNTGTFQSALLIDAAGNIRSACLQNAADHDSLSAIGAAAISFARRGLRVANQGKPLYSLIQGENGCLVILTLNANYFLIAISGGKINPLTALEELLKVGKNLVGYL